MQRVLEKKRSTHLILGAEAGDGLLLGPSLGSFGLGLIWERSFWKVERLINVGSAIVGGTSMGPKTTTKCNGSDEEEEE